MSSKEDVSQKFTFDANLKFSNYEMVLLLFAFLASRKRPIMQNKLQFALRELYFFFFVPNFYL